MNIAILCTSHSPRLRKYFIIFNQQNDKEKYIDYSSPFLFYCWDNKDFKNIRDYIKVTKQEAYETRI